MAILLRAVFPLADPPWQIPVGVVWHDEGAWTHNARNMALFGTWETDRWNPMYLAPVFNALEYASFRLFGVGLWQARLVSEVLGFASVLLVAGAVRRAAGRTAGAMAGALMATNYVWVMWNRAALLETAMVVPMTAALYAYARAERTAGSRAALWGALASVFAVAAFFSKAAAAFFPVALLVVAVAGLVGARRGRAPERASSPFLDAHTGVILGLAVSAAVAAVVFVIPYWTEFRFYNWQMSVTRKPSYTWEAFVDRASWLPVVHDFFTRQWMLLLLALGALFSTLARWRTSTAVERLSVAWILVGCAELIVHDVGNERRFVFLVPPLVTLAAVVLGRDRRLLAPEASSIGLRHLAAASPLILLCAVRAGGLGRAGRIRASDQPRRAARRGRGRADGDRPCAPPGRVRRARCHGRHGRGAPPWRCCSSSWRATWRASSSGPRAARITTTTPCARWPTGCRQARSSTASSRTDSPSRAASGRCSSAAASATTTTASSATTSATCSPTRGPTSATRAASSSTCCGPRAGASSGRSASPRPRRATTRRP